MARFRIMVVDDEAPITRMLRAILERTFDAEVLEFNEATEALGYYRGHVREIDLLICDLRMPGLSGMDLCRRVRAESAEVPIVILTAYATDEAEDEARKVGVNEFVQKPFLPKPFLASIRGLLGLPASDA